MLYFSMAFWELKDDYLFDRGVRTSANIETYLGKAWLSIKQICL